MPATRPRGRRKTYVSNRNFIILLAVFALVAFGEIKSRFGEEGGDLARFFTPYEGCLVLRDLSSGQTTRHNPDLAAKRLSPMSTFKIANALIALDSGVASGPDMVLAWDGRPRPLPAWNQDHTLASAIQNSVVWYFQELARRVGPQRMGAYLKALDYGNADISSGVDTFWLGGSLAISAQEQVDFLTRLYREELPLKPQAQAQVKQMLMLEKGDKGVLHGKTGSGGLTAESSTLGWFVGWVEQGGKVHILALHLQGQGANGPQARQTAQAILGEFKLW